MERNRRGHKLGGSVGTHCPKHELVATAASKVRFQVRVYVSDFYSVSTSVVSLWVAVGPLVVRLVDT